ncbi:uncharacterized protein TEOVI_000899000 [Trypanosoma equiperdum]|uniref:Mediator of RNA polymerase II transcription subunit 21 n=4 Tax=Trypanozoon TaxID=39700 RepID=Q387I6_TRYB2|nr:hypothetical protein, conserved [Trypanosoma brucei gambiense DAL972]XP_828157.1 hypothetical protein, conserved [Trypanosoma brucei brucei TREU927]RHW67438.1 hypothetical protein DPX39_110010600 [Trypanosoma brucei equiperdum]SCU64893.1 hypothetical protein, conserved [Trypanosoma equiperdum]EAN79045.1 hypothetical protein, conserved [Trypanosoma brucei brucei TREU927]CBH16948.1 hypothetical protein, conserved [Trypanosoma brucei gambiense DAL972]|eukprot:XP_011779212.1 hypothetical protein, conserved [Trypanosoma brucei gambiense DAL972]
MSGPVVEAEAALMHCVGAMYNALLETVDDAHPRFTADVAGKNSSIELVDTEVYQLEREHNAERQRVGRIADELERHFAALEGAIRALPDDPVASLDRDIELLNTEALSLAQAMIETYDEADALAELLQSEVETRKVPAI